MKVVITILTGLVLLVTVGSCGVNTEPGDGAVEGDPEEMPALPEDDDWDPPEPGSSRVRNTSEPDPQPDRDVSEPEEVYDEFVLHLPRPGDRSRDLAADEAIGTLGSEYTGMFGSDTRNKEAYSTVEDFLTALRSGDFASDLVDDAREASVRRRVQPVIDGNVTFDLFRVGEPERTAEAIATNVRLFAADTVRRSRADITGEVYLDEDGLIEDVQLDVRALEE